VKYGFISEQKHRWPIAMMCRLLGVSRNGYHAYVKSPARAVDPEHVEMLDWVKDIAEASDYTYGSRRMKRALNALGYPVSRPKARKLMREAGVRAKRKQKYKVTTNSNHKHAVFENLLNREFNVEKPDTVYASDITYIWTSEGWLYLAVVIDLYSRKVVGWDISSRANTQMVINALEMAVLSRQPDRGLIHHSDRGTQYASKRFKAFLKKHGIRGSMSRKGDCWDNSVVESFFGTLKRERVHWRDYATRDEAYRDVLNYITMFYNSERLHSYLDYVSPNTYEQQMQIAA